MTVHYVVSMTLTSRHFRDVVTWIQRFDVQTPSRCWRVAGALSWVGALSCLNAATQRRYFDVEACFDVETKRHFDVETKRHFDVETKRHFDVETKRRFDVETLVSLRRGSHCTTRPAGSTATRTPDSVDTRCNHKAQAMASVLGAVPFGNQNFLKTAGSGERQNFRAAQKYVLSAFLTLVCLAPFSLLACLFSHWPTLSAHSQTSLAMAHHSI